MKGAPNETMNIYDGNGRKTLKYIQSEKANSDSNSRQNSLKRKTWTTLSKVLDWSKLISAKWPSTFSIILCTKWRLSWIVLLATTQVCSGIIRLGTHQTVYQDLRQNFSFSIVKKRRKWLTSSSLYLFLQINSGRLVRPWLFSALAELHFL